MVDDYIEIEYPMDVPHQGIERIVVLPVAAHVLELIERGHKTGGFVAVGRLMLGGEHGVDGHSFDVGSLVDHNLLVLGGTPPLLLASCARHDHVVHVLGIGAYLEVLLAQVTLHAELVYGRAEIGAHLALLGVVAHAHGDVRAASLAPDVVGHLESDDQYALVEFACALSKRMRAVVAVQRAMLLRIEVRRVVLVLAFAFALFCCWF